MVKVEGTWGNAVTKQAKKMPARILASLAA